MLGTLRSSLVRAVGAIALVCIAVFYYVGMPSAPANSTGMPGMPKRAFATMSKDIGEETDKMAKLMGLKPGSTVGEVGGGNGSVLINLVPHILPNGQYYGTGYDSTEVSAMQEAATKAGLSEHTSIAVAQELKSGLPAGKLDAIVLRMVYHMLQNPAEYLADFYEALKPNGKLLILEHNPDNGKTVREGAVLEVAMGGQVMAMKVVPQQAMIQEAEAAGFGMLSDEPFEWEYFTGNHYVNGKDGRGYGIVFMKARDIPPPPPPLPLCNCGCGSSSQCGASCSACECDGCMPVKPICNAECGAAGQCGVACSPCDCE